MIGLTYGAEHVTWYPVIRPVDTTYKVGTGENYVIDALIPHDV